MSETKVKSMKGAVVSLAFRVAPMADNLFSTEIILLKGGTVVDKKQGEPTLMGHAIGQAQELIGHCAISDEKSAEEYFADVVVC